MSYKQNCKICWSLSSTTGHIKDTSGFNSRINQTKDINKDTIFVMLDVKSLYTKIPNHEGVEAVKSTLNCLSQKPIATKVIIKFLFLILILKNCLFRGIHFLHYQSSSIFTKYKQDLICEQFVHQITLAFPWNILKKAYLYINLFSTFYYKCIDDILFLWNGAIIQLQECIKSLTIDSIKLHQIL